MTANIIFHGITNNAFDLAYDNADVESVSGTQVILLDSVSGYRTTITGTSFAFNAAETPVGGTVSKVTIRDCFNNLVLSINSIAWGLPALDLAIQDLSNDQTDESLFEGLLNLQPINFDGSGANIGGISGLTKSPNPSPFWAAIFVIR
jgi:hypothetical protein